MMVAATFNRFPTSGDDPIRALTIPGTIFGLIICHNVTVRFLAGQRCPMNLRPVTLETTLALAPVSG